MLNKFPDAHFPMKDYVYFLGHLGITALCQQE